MAIITRTTLTALKAERDALNAEIEQIEKGFARAAYDSCMAEQLVAVNDGREREGRPKLTMSQFVSGVEHP